MEPIRNWLALFGSTGPTVSLGLVYGLALSGLTLGVLLLLWGRLLARPVMALLCAGIGVLLAPALAGRTELELLWVQIGAGVLLGVAGLLLAPVLWAVVGGLLAAAGAAKAVLLWRHPAPPESVGQRLQEVAGGDLQAWADKLGQSIWNSLQLAAEGAEALFFGVTGATLIAVLVLLVLRLRVAVALVTALLGGMCIVYGGSALSLAVRPGLWEGMRQHFYVPAGICVGLWAFGSIYQLLHRRSTGEKKEDGSEPDDSSQGKSDRGEKKAKRKRSAKAE